MLLKLIAIGKTKISYLNEGINEYRNRLSHYLPFELVEIPDVKVSKGTSPDRVKSMEGDEIQKKLDASAFVILLDENGKGFSSEQFAAHLQKRFNSGGKEIAFVIGGPYGFSEEVVERANERVSLSSLTFSHQMVRLIAMEQLYRAMTILRNEPYHHG